MHPTGLRPAAWLAALLALLLAAPLASGVDAPEPAEGLQAEADEDGPELPENQTEVDEDGPELPENQTEVDEDGPEAPRNQTSGPAAPPGQDGQDEEPAEPEQSRDDADEEEDDGIDDGDDYFETAAPASQPAVGFNVTRASGEVLQQNVTTLATILLDVSEFIDANGNLRYDLGEPVLQRVPLAGVPGTLDARDRTTRHVNYAIPAGGHLSLLFHLSPGDPSRPAKFDVLVEGFPFQSNASRLAVSLQVHVAGGIRFTTVGGDPAIAGLGEGAPFLAWSRTVEADGVAGTVGASLHLSADASAGDGVLTWSYPQGATILHDPVLGIVPAGRPVPLPAGIGDLQVVAIAAAAGLALLAAGYAIRRRVRL